MIARKDTMGAELQLVDPDEREALAYYRSLFAPIIRMGAIGLAIGAGYLAGVLIGGAQ